MYRFRFGNIFALLDQIKLKKGSKLSSKDKLYAALVNPKNEFRLSTDPSDVGKIQKGEAEPLGTAIVALNKIPVVELTQCYLSDVLPYLNQSLFKPLVLAIKELLKNDTNLSDSYSFTTNDCIKSKIINDNVVFLARLLACLTKSLINQPNLKRDNEEPLPKNYVASFSKCNEIDNIKIVNNEEDVATPLVKSLNASDFFRIFEEVNPNTYSLNISNTNRFKVYILDIYKKDFETGKLVNFIEENISSYLRSRNYIKEKQEDGKSFTLALYSIDEFRSKVNNKCEAFSQIMTYAFMESVLHAPKIYSAYELTKITELRGSNISGVYLLPYGSVEGSANQLVYGSSNVKDSMNAAIDKVLEIAYFIDNNHLDFGRHISNNIFHYGNDFPDETKKFLRETLIPDRNKEVPTINSFGIFFSYSINNFQPSTSNVYELKNEIRKAIDNDIRKAIPYIESKIRDLDLNTYPFYFFVLPLVNAESVTSEVIDKVLRL